MKLSENKYLAPIIAEPTIFIAGGKEDLRIDTLDQLLELNLEHLYFISPSDRIVNFLTILLTNNEFSIIKSTSEIPDLNQKNIIACGFEVISPDFNLLKSCKKKKILLFILDLGYLKDSLEKQYQNFRFIEESFNEFVKTNTKKQIIADPEIKKGERDLFKNRGREITIHTEFVADKGKKACKIIGMPGIGKRAFINELRSKYGLNKNYFEFPFENKFDSLSDILIELFERFGIKYNEKEIKRIKLNKNRIAGEIKKFFQEFDSLDDAKIVFTNINEVYDLKKKQFYKYEIALFFHLLLHRDTYNSKNKIYFVSSNDFYLGAEDENIIQTIRLGTIDSMNIKNIISQAFSENNYAELAAAINDIDDEKIKALIGGHPQIAKLFVRVSQEMGMDKIVNDLHFQKEFEQNYKVKYLLEKVPLNEFEQKLLNHLALFRGNFSHKFVKKLTTDVFQALEDLRNRFLLEIVHLKNGESQYYIPTLIQNYVILQLTNEIYKQNHNNIGYFYWDLAEEFEKPIEVLNSFKSALYHFTEAENKTKLNELTMRFSDKFEEKAKEYYKNGQLEDAFDYYHELYKIDKLSVYSLTSYLTCNAKLDKKNARILFEKAIKDFPDHIPIKNSFANYLFRKGEFIEAEKICLASKKINSEDYVNNNLYAKIRAKLGHKQESLEYFEKRIESFKQLKNPGEQEINNYVINNMSYYSLIEYHIVFQLVKTKTIELLKSIDLYDNKMDVLFDSPLPEEIAQEIEDIFEKALTNKHAHQTLVVNYYNFLLRQNKPNKAQDILEKKSFYPLKHTIEISPLENQNLDKVDNLKGEALTKEIVSSVSSSKLEEVIKKMDIEKNEQSISKFTKKEPNNSLNGLPERPIDEIVINYISDLFTICAEKLDKANEVLNNILKVKKERYPALYAYIGLQITYGDFDILKSIFELCKNEKERKEFIEKQKNELQVKNKSIVSHKDLIKELIKDGVLGKAIEEFIVGTERNGQTDLHGSLIQQSARYNDNEKAKKDGVISFENYKMEKAMINKAVIDYLEEYKPTENKTIDYLLLLKQYKEEFN